VIEVLSRRHAYWDPFAGDRTRAEESIGEEPAEDRECAEGAGGGFVFGGVTDA
jgi:hypothetical protein